MKLVDKYPIDNSYRPVYNYSYTTEYNDALLLSNSSSAKLFSSIIAVNLINMEKFPTVKFGVSYDWLGDNVNKSKKDWYVALNINYPIFDGGAVFSRLKQKKIKARQATIERSKIEEKIKLEVMKAFSEYKFWYKKFLKIKNMKATTIEQEILKEDIKYNYIKSLVILDLAIGK